MPTRRSVLEAIAGAPAARPAVTSDPEPLRIAIYATERATDADGTWHALAECALEVRRALQEAFGSRVVVELRGPIDATAAPLHDGRRTLQWWEEAAPDDAADAQLLAVSERCSEAWGHKGWARYRGQHATFLGAEEAHHTDHTRTAIHELGHVFGARHRHGETPTIAGIQTSTAMTSTIEETTTMRYSEAAARVMRADQRT